MNKKLFTGTMLTLLLSLTSVAQAQKPHAMLNHIAVYVSDLAESTTFYQHIVGLDTIPEPFNDGKHTWFEIAPRIQLHLIEGDGDKISYNKNSHLCFSVRSIPEFIVRLRQAGIEYESWTGEKEAFTTRVDGVKQIYFKDPDNQWIEINDENGV